MTTPGDTSAMRLSPSALSWLAGAALGLILLVAAPMLWPAANYLNAGYWAAVLVASVIAGGVLVVITEGRVALCAALLTVGVMCAFAIRVAIDAHHDRTSHNLLPFEVLFQSVLVFVCASVGGLFGALATRETRPSVRK